MTRRRCPYCHQLFTPCRYRPDQAVCGAPDCQRQRRAAYHRKKLTDDSSYRAQCRDSQRQWREQHPEYMPRYRQSHPRPAPKTRPGTESPPDIVRLLECVKNNLAIELSACSARVFVVCIDEPVKNILATAELILIEGLPKTRI